MTQGGPELLKSLPVTNSRQMSGYFFIASITGEDFTTLASLGFCSFSDSNSLKACVSSNLSCMYKLIRIKIKLAKKGIRHPQERKDSSLVNNQTVMKAKLANITPIGAPACAKAP